MNELKHSNYRNRSLSYKLTLAAMSFSFLFGFLNTGAQTVTKQLYLSDPSQSLDRIDPVATADATTANSFLLSTTNAGVALANSSTGYSANPNSTTFTVSHTTLAGDNRLMLVGISQKNKLVTSVTYGGVPLTLVGERISNGNVRVHIYRLISPAVGTGNVVVNLSANPDRGIVVGVVNFTGVDQVNPLGTFAAADGNGSIATTTVSSAAGEVVFDVATFRNTTMTANGSQTVLYNINSGGEIDGGGASTKPGAASVTMTWNGLGSEDWAIGAVPVKPATAVLYTTFTQAPDMCIDLTIKAGNTITVTAYLSIQTGVMPANPDINADIKYGASTILSLVAPTYNSGTGLLTWTGSLVTDVTVPAGEAIILDISTEQPGVSFRIQFDSQTKPSKISLPVSTYINVNSVDVYTAAYPGGIPVNGTLGGTTKYLRAVVSDPFGYSDISSLNFTITPGATVAGTSVATYDCIRVYEYVWNVPATPGTYIIDAVAKEGFENSVTHSKSTSISVCVNCPPSAVNDSTAGPGGVPVIMDVLINDSDPNNNINNSSLTVFTQPSNGTALISNGKLVYIPNGTFSGKDTVVYQICDLTIPTPLCATALAMVSIDATVADACIQASRTHTYFIPYPEQDAYTSLVATSSFPITSNLVRTVISLKIPYAGMRIVWDEWEDGYESNPLSPTQSSTKVWGDANIFNGFPPGYPLDFIPAGGSIVVDNTMTANPRNPANFYYDGKDKVISSGQIAMTQVSGEPSLISVQAMKTNITSTYDFGQSFTVPFGQDFNSQDFVYTSLFIRSAQDNTTISIDKDNNGNFETFSTLQEGDSYLVNGGVLTGAVVTSDKPVGVEVCAGGVDMWSLRNVPIFPATWYSSVYYTPIPTSDVAGHSPKDSSAVMFYNSLNRPLTINWNNGVPASGSFVIAARSAYRYPLAYSTTAAYKFENLGGESFTAIEVIDSYTPGGGGNSGSEYDWSFNLISEARLTDYATIAWAPGSIDGTRNDNPIWVTPTSNTTIYVKYDGDVLNGGSPSPCGLRYDVSYNLNALNYLKLLDPNDNDQGGLAVYTCNGAKIAAVYGEDPASAVIGSPSWDVGSTIQPFCKDKMIFANDDYAETPINQPVTISVLLNDVGFRADIDPASVNVLGLLQPAHGTVTVNANGTILYRPDSGYTGFDYFEYQVCSTPTPVKCDIALVTIRIEACPSGSNVNLITGQTFIDLTKDGINNDGGTALYPAKVYLYIDGNCSGGIDANELADSVSVDNSGYYQFRRQPEKMIADNFNTTGGSSSCATGSDGNTPWLTNWVDAGEGSSTGYCVTPAHSNNNTDAEIILDGAFSYALRLDDNNVSATRQMNLSSASKAFLSFSYRRASVSLITGENVLVQMSTDGSAWTTIYTISGSAATDAAYVRVYNQDISAYAGATSYLRFLTNNSVDEGDYVFIDDINVQFMKYNQCYITQLDTASVPAYFNLTTSGESAITFTGGGTCSTNKDFGVAKSSVQVTGTVYHDSNALTDALVNGPAIGAPSGATLYAYLIDTSGKVILKTTVNSGTGNFSFTQADIDASYTLKISSINVAQFANEPAAGNLPGTWYATGEDFGTNNAAGSGVESGTPNYTLSVNTTTLDISGIKYGIQQVPNSDDKITAITHPTVGQFITLNGGVNPPILSGSDPEDCSGGCLLTARNLVIDAYPDNAELYYNSLLVNDGDLITNFDSNLLQIKVTAATIGDSTIQFLYSFVDQAGKQDASPATYLVYWPWALPATGLTLSAKLNNEIANLGWITYTEQLTSHFILERSTEGLSWTTVAGNIPAAGESVDQRNYHYLDNIENLVQHPVIYYRVKLVDLDARISYSNIATVKPTNNIDVTVKPNPFKSVILLDIHSKTNTRLLVRFTDMAGQHLRTERRNVSRGITNISIANLESLAPAMYMLEVVDEVNKKKTVVKVFKVE